MDIKERQKSLLNEAKALVFFFGITSNDLSTSFKDFDELYSSTEHVTTAEFEFALNAIDAEIEALCIVHKVTQENLEDLMSNNFSFKAVTV